MSYFGKPVPKIPIAAFELRTVVGYNQKILICGKMNALRFVETSETTCRRAQICVTKDWNPQQHHCET